MLLAEAGAGNDGIFGTEEWQQFSLAGVTTVVEKPLLSHDLKFSLRHLNDFSRCAIVSDAKLLSLVSTIAEPFIDCQVAYFKLNEVEPARDWLLWPEGAADAI